ncbi:MAG: B12-binding domain-containing radical SAM protein [Gemmatimonadaceae bacterium]
MLRVFLADLGHNQMTISSDVYPLGVANLATYARAHLEIAEPLEITLFREPQDLKRALDAGPPDILGLSSYSWNHNLSRSFARYARTHHPGLLTVMGGPNFPLTHAEQESFLRGMPEIDIAVRGPTYEGERSFLNLLQRFVDVGRSREGVLETAVDGSLWIHPRTGDAVRGAEVPRIVDLDDIPSPYLAGLMDEWFATGYFPLLQIARGCPFTCQFCNSSVKSNTKVFHHSLENVRSDLIYIAERVRHEMPLCFADDNFGMYELDVEIADVIADCQDRYKWPRYIRTTTGKNRGERIIQVMRKIRGSLPMTSAVQSMNPEVLKNIQRSNIKLDTYAEIQKELRAQGMQSYGELILCLPGESKATFLKGVSDLLDTGVKRISAHQLMLLHGAPLSNPDQRARFGFRTRYRVVARDVGDYTGEPVVETEEMVVETPTFSFDDYLETRVFHLLLTIFYYEGNVEEAFEFARHHGIKPFDLIVRMQSLLDQAPPGFREVIDAFLQESRDELFDSRDECEAWAVRHLEELLGGIVGGNLLSKYSMLGRFFATQESLDFLQLGIVAVLGEKAAGETRVQLHAVIDYLRSVLLHAPFARTLAECPTWQTSYDLEAWRRDRYEGELAAYRTPGTRRFTMRVDPERRALIESRVATFGEHPTGLGKFTRTMFAQDLRRTVLPANEGTRLPMESVLAG